MFLVGSELVILYLYDFDLNKLVIRSILIELSPCNLNDYLYTISPLCTVIIIVYICSSYKINKMSNGTVKFFNNSKGFGFITPESGEKDVFVHVNGLIDEINEGDKVSYEVEEGPKGMNAVKVRVV